MNAPERYASVDPRRSKLLVSLVRRFSAPDSRVLEIGCNVGRNLEHLRRAGYTSSLSGVEISDAAVEVMGQRFPELAATATIHVGAVEDLLPSFPDDAFDVACTLAVLEHIHTDSEWIFEHIVRIAPVVVTIEDESERSARHFPRDYRRVFEDLGMKEVHAQRCDSTTGLSSNFMARVFTREAERQAV
jgi:SAM-dependent methyltransferase